MSARRPVLSAVLLAAVGAAAACTAMGTVDVRMSMPGVSPFAPGTFSKIIIANFRDEAASDDFAPAPALEEVLERTLGRALKERGGRVVRARVEAVAGRDEPAVWKAAGAAEDPGTVYLAGSVRLSGEILKALDKSLPQDGPFDLVRRLIAKRRWRLDVELYVVSAATGETLDHQSFSEFQDYGELDKEAEFGFNELSDRVMGRISQALLGTPTIEVRSLLRR